MATSPVKPIVTAGSVTSGIAWVAIWYLASIASAIVILSAVQIKSRLGVDEAGMNPLAEIRANHLQIASLDRQGTSLQNVISALSNQRIELDVAYEDARKELTRIALIHGVSGPDAFEPAPPFLAAVPDAQRHEVVEQRAGPLAELQNYAFRVTRVDAQIATRGSELMQISGRRIELNKLSEKSPRHREAAEIIGLLDRVHLGLLLDLPGEILVLLLALVMGALGSTIHITRVLLEPSGAKPFSWYVYRPGLGMITALAMFVLLKAGQITISDVNSSDNLNPFFVSFVAIVAGLLSTRAQTAIEHAGAKIFPATQEEMDRWAIGLQAALAAQNVDFDRLATHIGVERSIIDEWVAGMRAVPAQCQRRIADYLRTERRQLFTSDPPP